MKVEKVYSAKHIELLYKLVPFLSIGGRYHQFLNVVVQEWVQTEQAGRLKRILVLQLLSAYATVWLHLIFDDGV